MIDSSFCRPTHGAVEGPKLRRLAKSVSKTPSERQKCLKVSLQDVPKCLKVQTLLQTETSYSTRNVLSSTPPTHISMVRYATAHVTDTSQSL
jgi:hypothetical protein